MAKVDLASTRYHCPKPSGFADFSAFQMLRRPRLTRVLAMAWRLKPSPVVPRSLRYGIELDAYRAEQAMQRIPNIVQGNTLEVQCPVECFGLFYLNPPLSKRFFSYV